MDKLTHEDIERNRAELADLERCFLERVAQINKCKGGSGGPRISTSINTGMPQQLQSPANRYIYAYCKKHSFCVVLQSSSSCGPQLCSMLV
jgi:hypothetical protein